jgi:hypothetical protein
MRSQWRAQARPIIARVLREMRGAPEPELRKALRAAFPFNAYEGQPYRIWHDEIKRQRGLLPRLKTDPPLPDPRQLQLFNEEETST